MQYKHVIAQIKETNDAPRKKVIDVIKKQNFTIEVQIYGVSVHNVRVVEIKKVVIDLDNLVEVVVGQVRWRVDLLLVKSLRNLLKI